jgi:zinc protease
MLTLPLTLLLAQGCAGKNPDLAAPAAFALPDPGPLPAFEPPAPEVRTLANGAALWVVSLPELPLVSMRVVFDGGARLDPEGQWGVASLAADLMDESAGEHSAAELSRALRDLAAYVSTSSTRDSIELRLDVHSDRLEPALALAADVALRPAFSDEDWERVHARTLNALAQRSESAGDVAVYLAGYQYYGERHPLGRPVDGTRATVEGLSLDDARAAWARSVQPGRATFVVVGDIDADRAQALLEVAFDEWPEAGEVEEIAPGDARPGAGQCYLVDMPGATQTALRLMGDGYVPGDAGAPGAELARTVIGGSFTSRLNQLMRVEKNYTYGASGYFVPRRGDTTWMVSTSVEVSHTGEAIEDMLGVLDGAAGSFTEEDASKAAALMFADAVGAAETRAALASTLAARARVDRAPDGAAAELAAARAAGVVEMEAATEQYLDTSKMQLLMVGDAEQIAPQLEAIGRECERIEEPE